MNAPERLRQVTPMHVRVRWTSKDLELLPEQKVIHEISSPLLPGFRVQVAECFL